MASRRLNIDPPGARLSDIVAILRPSTITTTHIGNTLIGDHGSYQVRVEVVLPEVRETDMGPIMAVIQINTELPRQILDVFGNDIPSLAAQ
jgi:hypothetical protein